jgi:hypothetical protein
MCVAWLLRIYLFTLLSIGRVLSYRSSFRPCRKTRREKKRREEKGRGATVLQCYSVDYREGKGSWHPGE